MQLLYCMLYSKAEVLITAHSITALIADCVCVWMCLIIVFTLCCPPQFSDHTPNFHTT